MSGTVKIGLTADTFGHSGCIFEQNVPMPEVHQGVGQKREGHLFAIELLGCYTVSGR
jgi:hypothetical protein